MPVEIPGAVPFDQDKEHKSYDPEYAQRFWRILVQVDRVCTLFRSRFLGKVSPVHFFWGSFDLAVSRFSGRAAPALTSNSPNLGAWVMQEAYSHEVCSCGFWPAMAGLAKPHSTAMRIQSQLGFSEATVRPDAAHYDPDLGQFILPYDAVRRAASPDDDLLDFLRAAYRRGGRPGALGPRRAGTSGNEIA